MTFIQVFGGHPVDFLDPKPDQIKIKAVAHSLAMQCRFGGNCDPFYSVAQHSCHAYDVAPDEYKLEALLHDAPESVLVDIPRPIKNVLSHPVFVLVSRVYRFLKRLGFPIKMIPMTYRDIEAQLDRCIRDKYGLPLEMTPVVRKIDDKLLATERRDLMDDSERPWDWLPEPYAHTIVPWSPERAKAEFLTRFSEKVAAHD